MMAQGKKIKVLIAKVGLDGHDRGALVVTYALRDEGMEVIYTGIRQTPEKIVRTAIQEDVDVVGLSCLSGAYNYLFPKVTELLRQEGMGDVLVVGGGIFDEKDIPLLKEKGIAALFGPGISTKQIAEYIRQNLESR